VTRPKGISSTMQGQAAVYRVASELMFREIPVALPVADDRGVDIIALPSIRIQVKSAYLRHHHRVYPQGAYWFKFVQGPIVSGNHTIKKRGPRQFSAQCDFVVLMGIDQGRFWIVPAHILDGKSLCVVGPDSAGADRPRSVKTGRFALVRQIRECEGRWDYLTGALTTAHEAKQVIGNPLDMDALKKLLVTEG
jgi:hypothetical protein